MTFSDLLPPFEQRGMDLSLDRMVRALAALDHPCATVPAVQVVGTNGKGSIASFIHSGLIAAGLRTGLTTSPHLMEWTERIRVNHQQISPTAFRTRLQALQPLAAQEKLTPFELVITTALQHFAAEQVDWLVLEAGLGGRLDATTAHPNRPLLAVASIGFDHCEHLGTNLTAITGEKAAAIQPGAVVISGPQHPEVEAVLKTSAEAMDADLRWVSPLGLEWELGLNGDHQRSNAAVAKGILESIQAMGWPLESSSIRKGLASARWPGRLQTIDWRQHQVLIDGAHNPPAAEALRSDRRHWPNAESGITWILAMQAHKQAPAMLDILLEPNDQAWIVPVPGHPSWDRSMLVQSNPAWADQLRELPAVSQQRSSRELVETVLRLVDQQGWPRAKPVIAGSLYLVGDLLAGWPSQDQHFKAKR